MKKLLLLFSSLAFLGQINAQTPHKDLGIKESEIEYLTLSDGRYDEYHGYKDFERVGSAVIDMRTRKIAYFISRDSILDEGMFELDMTTRFLTIDPLAEKYFEMSPYGYCANNPIKFIDPNGMSIDNYIVDESGVVKDIEKNDEPNKLFVENNSGERTELELNDPKNDGQQLESFSVGDKAVEFVSDANVNEIMNESEMKSENLTSRWYTAATQSENKMDFGVRYLKANPTQDNTGGFAVFGTKNKAYNLLDGGNFLWGQGMKRLGFNLSNAKFGANANELFKDTPSDQQAIGDGFNYNVVTSNKSDKYKYSGDKNGRR